MKKRNRLSDMDAETLASTISEEDVKRVCKGFGVSKKVFLENSYLYLQTNKVRFELMDAEYPVPVLWKKFNETTGDKIISVADQLENIEDDSEKLEILYELAEVCEMKPERKLKFKQENAWRIDEAARFVSANALKYKEEDEKLQAVFLHNIITHVRIMLTDLGMKLSA